MTFAHPLPPTARRAASTGIAALAALAGLAASPAQAAPPLTLDLVASQGRLSAGQPDAQAANLRATWQRDGGDVLRGEWLAEDKFGRRGGLLGAGYTAVLSPDWVASGSLALGYGGPYWARHRLDGELSRSWGDQRAFVTRAGFYRAVYEAQRSDSGLRLSGVAYLPGSWVLEAGTAINRSQPGGLSSAMPFASATWGRDGEHYLSLRASRGSEAWLATSAGTQAVRFDSHSLGLNWRQWVGPAWGYTVQAEQYVNPSYRRNTLGAGLFAQW